MKTMLFLVFSLLSIVSYSQSVYYVQDPAYNDKAKDSNDGKNIDYPWATWQKAFQTAKAGDTVYFRGGTWYPGPDLISLARLDPETGLGHKGTPSNPIVFMNYPNETPILDAKNNYPPGHSTAAVTITNSAYIELHGLTVQNVLPRPVENGELYTTDFVISNNTHVTLNNCVGRFGGGVGYYIAENDTVILNNCDSHDRCDSLDLGWPGGDADGFIISSGDKGDWSILYMTGCRAWNCSDDGIDLATYKQVYLSHNWSFNNGDFGDGYRGDGTGIKTSGSVIKDVNKRRIHNNITAYNVDGGGIAELNLYSPAAPYMQLYNNTIYKEDKGYRSSISGGDWDYDEHGGKVVSTNNLIYQTTHEPVGYSEHLTAIGSDDDPFRWVTTITDSWVFTGKHWYNEYNPAFTITDSSFTNLDSATIFRELSAPRKSNGDLPDITVLRLTKGSDLIDGGTDVGLPYFGSAPDLGALEYGSLFIDLLSPTEDSEFALGDKINIKMLVEDDLNEIREVNLYINNKIRKIGSGEKTGPSLWEFNWTCDTIGVQTLRAVAFNSQGDSATSSRKSIFINPYEGPNPEGYYIIPNPNNGVFELVLNESLKAPSEIQIISIDGKVQSVETMSPNDKRSKKFFLSHLGQGFYILQFMNEESLQSPSNNSVKFVIR